MSVGERSVVFLLGAGCSFDAGIPVSGKMIEKLESLLSEKHDNTLFPLYNYVKHTIDYGNKLFGIDRDFNIESLLVTLHALSEHKKTHLYPFVNGYRNDLLELAGADFSNVKQLIEVIENELAGWVTLGSYKSAEYYKNFQKFQSQLNFAIRIFSLNYDLCLEKNVECKIETGFYEDQPWDGNRFLQNDDDDETAIYLYKLHGSIYWQRINGQLCVSEQSYINPDVIFGTDLKMQAIDPYLFYLYEFRKYVSSSELIVTIGYSYNDSHINDLISQAMISNEKRVLINVSPCDNTIKEQNRLLNRLKLKEGQTENIIIVNETAKDFLENTLSVDYIGEKLPESDLPF